MRLFKVINFLLKSGEVYIYARFSCPPAYIEDIQFFGMNMSIILWSKAKKNLYFMSGLRLVNPPMNYTFFLLQGMK